MAGMKEAELAARSGRPSVEALAARGRDFVADNWKVVLYVLLILLCVLFAPEEPLKFIYTEF